jgi:hypothetical protein
MNPTLAGIPRVRVVAFMENGAVKHRAAEAQPTGTDSPPRGRVATKEVEEPRIERG